MTTNEIMQSVARSERLLDFECKIFKMCISFIFKVDNITRLNFFFFLRKSVPYPACTVLSFSKATSVVSFLIMFSEVFYEYSSRYI